MHRVGDYRTSAAPIATLESACLLCGREGHADSACPTCSVPMPRLTCVCGAVNGVTSQRCATCGEALVEAPVHARGCARCTTPLTEIGIDPSASVHVCLWCRGVFVPPRAFFLLLSRDDLVQALASRLPPSPSATSAAPAPMFACPECSEQMERGRFAATSTVVIDACTRHGLWLDAGELAGAVAYARHRRTITAEDAVKEAEALERQKTGYDSEQARRELRELAELNDRSLPIIKAAASGRPSDGDFFRGLLFLVVLVLLLFSGQLARAC